MINFIVLMYYLVILRILKVVHPCRIQNYNCRQSFNLYQHVCIRRGVSNRRGGSDKISKMLQEGCHFLIRGGSEKRKMLQEGSLGRRGGSNTLHVLIIGGLRKSTNKSIYFEELQFGISWGSEALIL